MADLDETKAGGTEIPIATAAQLLMIGAERVRQLVKDGYIPKGKRGHVPLVGAVQGYLRFRDDADRRASKSAADGRVRDARAKEIELRNSVRLRELVPVEECHFVVDTFITACVAEMEGMPARITRDIPLRRKIDGEIRAARLRMVEKLTAAREKLENGGATANSHDIQ